MTKNPFINALTASAYITFVASIMFNGERIFGKARTVAVPIVILSLFTLSAAMMAYLFFYQPLQLYIDGKKKQAVNLFLKTVGIFAGITALVFLAFLSGILK